MAEEPRNKFHCLRAVVDGGYLARMGELEAKVYISLYNDADGTSRRVAVSNERIARNSGTANVNRARKTAHSLETLGVIKKVTQGGGRFLVNEWELLIPAPFPTTPLFETGTLRVPVSEDQTGTRTVPVSNGKGDAQRHERGTVSDTKGGRSAAETGTLSVPHSQRSQKSQHISRGEECGVILETSPPTPPPPTTPTSTPDATVLSFLVTHGIHLHPARRYAAAFSLAAVEALWKSVVAKPKVRDRAAFFNSTLTQNLPNGGTK